MENASRALIIAGSVLLAILVIGMLVLMFNTISELKSTEASSEEVEKLAQYNRQIEMFNKDKLYGSEILSLSNLIDDYNKTQADLKGYHAIKLEVHTNNAITDENNRILMQKDYTDYKDIINDFELVQKKTNEAKTITISGKKIDIQKIAGKVDDEIEYELAKLGIEVDTTVMNNIQNAITKYQTLKTTITEFKNRPFKLPEVEYEKSSGRIISMKFTQYPI